VTLHDGSSIHLSKLNPNWNPTDRRIAVDRLQKARVEGTVLTGLLYIEPDTKDLHDIINTTHLPLNSLKEEILCPGTDVLEKINAGFR
jgi:2-oxoglutarate ferredoxin oxidoreductase subunit beta